MVDSITDSENKIDCDSYCESYNSNYESDSNTESTTLTCKKQKAELSEKAYKAQKAKIAQIAQEKINITHNINLLKKEKEKLENDMNVYNLDLKLYYKFKNLLLENKKFILPELFENKYNIFKQLDDKGQLSFDNFVLLYNNESISTDYDGIFNNTPNDYENKFINHDNLDILKALEDQ
jgi:hypothetical protein